MFEEWALIQTQLYNLEHSPIGNKKADLCESRWGFFGHMRPKSFISLEFYRGQLKLCSKTKLFLLYNLADLDF